MLVFNIYYIFSCIVKIKKKIFWASKFGRPSSVELFAPQRAGPEYNITSEDVKLNSNKQDPKGKRTLMQGKHEKG
jgi:hypothetical protein